MSARLSGVSIHPAGDPIPSEAHFVNADLGRPGFLALKMIDAPGGAGLDMLGPPITLADQLADWLLAVCEAADLDESDVLTIAARRRDRPSEAVMRMMAEAGE